MNKTILQGKWRRTRGSLKTEWARLTDNDRQMLEGKIDQMVGVVQERYGYTQSRASKVLARYLHDYSKRSHKRAGASAKMWVPALSVVGLFSLATMGWFFFRRFWAEDATAQSTAPDYVASPEADLI